MVLMRNRLFFWVLGLLFVAGIAQAQLPKSNIYVFEINEIGDTAYQFNKPQYLTHFNVKGYNNQPYFFNDYELYITLAYPYQQEPDIFLFDLDERSKLQVTDTKDGEYSPKQMLDYYRFSAVRKEVNGLDTIQRLWEFPIDRLSNGKPVFKYVNNIGYYHWMNAYEVALFLVDSPNLLMIADTRTDRMEEVDTDIGRCFKSFGRSLIYLKKDEFRPNEIVQVDISYDGDVGEPTKLIEAIPNQEDFEILPDGTLLMASGSRIFKYNFRKDIGKDWEPIVDLKYYGIENISRMSLSPGNKIAIVAD